MSVSVVVRTYNEARHLPQLLDGIASQVLSGMPLETIVVDSGSEDGTAEMAARRGCRVVRIAKGDFTFGRSLNVGCEASSGDYLVFVSGHCIPASEHWIAQLVQPLQTGVAVYSYGRQLGNGSSRFSERQLFLKYYPPESRVPQDGFFCNNANAALLRSVWQKYRFNEELTGLEDMELASRICNHSLRVAYVADAPVFHLHEESWHKVRIRFEREAMALQQIMPQIHISLFDFARYFAGALALDCGKALEEGVLMERIGEIVRFRLMQFWGSYRGNHQHRKLSREMKDRYFYPK